MTLQAALESFFDLTQQSPSDIADATTVNDLLIGKYAIIVGYIVYALAEYAV